MSIRAACGRVVRKCNDFLVGPGATLKEDVITYCVALIGAITVTVVFLDAEECTWWKAIVLFLVAFDFIGGATANATNAARRWWHRPGSKPTSALAFMAFHVHPIIIGLLFDGFPLLLGVVAYAITIVAGIIVLFVPPEIMRPTAYGLCSLCMVTTASIPGVASYLGWMLPIMYIKLLLSHLLPDGSATAYRLAGTPSNSQSQ